MFLQVFFYFRTLFKSSLHHSLRFQKGLKELLSLESNVGETNKDQFDNLFELRLCKIEKLFPILMPLFE